jgi:hypothetical protein
VDSKHGATGTELRLDICVKDGSERTWSHEQVWGQGMGRKSGPKYLDGACGTWNEVVVRLPISSVDVFLFLHRTDVIMN